MKKKSLGILMMIACIGAALVVGTAFAAMDKTPSGEVEAEFTILDSGFPKHTKPGVPFTHEAHHKAHKVKCDECHHVYENGKNVWKDGDAVEKCHECHTSPKKNDGKMLSLYNAYHGNCRTCHKELKKTDKDTKAPNKCNECHVKKK